MNSHPTLQDVSSAGIQGSSFGEIDAGEVRAIVKRMAEELRKAGSVGLMNLKKGQLLLPNQLLSNIATKLVELGRGEPHGSRGCKLYMLYHDGLLSQVLGSIRFDTDVMPTYNLFLTLREERASLHGRINHFIRRVRRGGTLKLSKLYDLEKRKVVVSRRKNRRA